MKKYKNAIFPACLLVFDLLYFLQTLTVPVKDFSTVAGARLVPYICAAVLAICSVVLFVRAIRDAKRTEASQEQEPEEASTPSNYKNVVITLLLIVAYALLLSVLGFLVSTVLFVTAQIFILMPVRNKKNLLRAVIVAVIVTALVYLLFTKLFYVMLPSGTLW